MADKAVEALESCLLTFHKAGITQDSDPEALWQLHDYLGQAYKAAKNKEKEKEHNALALDILNGEGVASPQVGKTHQRYILTCICHNHFIVFYVTCQLFNIFGIFRLEFSCSYIVHMSYFSSCVRENMYKTC